MTTIETESEVPRYLRRGGRVVGIRTVVRRGLFIALSLALLAGAPGIIAVTTIISSADEIAGRLAPLQSENSHMLAALSTAETSLNSYLMSGDATFLTSYRQALASYQREAAIATTDARGDADAAAAVNEVRKRASEWLTAAHPIATGAANGPAASTALAAAFDRVQVASNAAGNELAREIREAGASADSTSNIALGFLCGAALFALGMTVVYRFRSRRTVVLPLEGLIDALARLRAGDRAARAQPGGPLEVRATALALNDLAERLSEDDRRRARIRGLSDLITRDIRERIDLSALLSEAAATIGVAFDVDRAFVRLVEEGEIGAIVAEWHRPTLEELGQIVERPPALQRIIDDAARRQASLVIEDAIFDPNYSHPAIQAHFVGLGLRAAVISPITAAGELIGSLVIIDADARSWQEDEVGLIEVAAGELGRAVQHGNLFEAQRELVAQLQELDRSKTEFLSTISHELRTPLTSITGYVEMLEEGEAGPINEGQQKMLEVVDRNARRLRGLIEDLLTLSRIEVGEFRVSTEPVDISELITAVVQVVEPGIQDKGLTLRTESASNIGLIPADRGQLERALLNLLANAVKFTPEGGAVTVTAERDGGEVAIAVTDTGIGIPPDELAHLSDRFFRASNATERAIPGTGLGLTIVRSIVEHHGGHLEVMSDLGIGTTFTLRIPAERRRRPRGGIDEIAPPREDSSRPDAMVVGEE